ncbi:MAG: helix-turn-helix transcriptional regulator [Clostridia bacterium]|nr:helix-turn-helix transcriptional regulator [Clostridia bacterium]
MELDYKAIGKRIKIARIHADMTQEALSGKIDLSPSHMSNIETGTTKVSLTTIVNIANALSVTVDDLLCDNLIRARIQMERDIQAVLNDCDDYEIRVAKNTVEAVIDALRKNKELQNG